MLLNGVQLQCLKIHQYQITGLGFCVSSQNTSMLSTSLSRHSWHRWFCTFSHRRYYLPRNPPILRKSRNPTSAPYGKAAAFSCPGITHMPVSLRAGKIPVLIMIPDMHIHHIPVIGTDHSQIVKLPEIIHHTPFIASTQPALFWIFQLAFYWFRHLSFYRVIFLLLCFSR